MKRVMLLLAALGMMMLAASPAMAQSFTNPNPAGSEPCPTGFSSFGDPGTGELTCIAPEDLPAFEAGTLGEDDLAVFGENDGVCVGLAEGDPDCAEAFLQAFEESQQSAPLAPTSEGTVQTPVAEAPVASETMTALPDTGGASLIALGAGALLVAGGLLIRKR